MTYLELDMDPVSGRFSQFPTFSCTKSCLEQSPADTAMLTLSSVANLLTSDLSILLQTTENSIGICANH